MIDAKEARIKAQEIINARHKMIEDHISGEIQDAISKGLFEIEYPRIEPPIKRLLESKGYKIEIINNKQGPATNIYYKISF